MADYIDRARSIFGNEISEKDYQAALKAKEGFIMRFGDDANTAHHIKVEELNVIGEALGCRLLAEGDAPLDLYADATSHPSMSATDFDVPGAHGKPVVVGNIRMGFGHYRIAMAMASAAHALGFTPYWFDLSAFPASTCSKIIAYQNNLYSMGSRLSQNFAPFNSLYWEPLNSEGFRKLSYNASDQKVAELMAPLLDELPKDVPFVGTHVWPAQAAVHAGLTSVVNAIPDNWPMALHLAEGSIHTVQTPSSYLGYRQLRGMDEKRTLNPMNADSLVYTGHYVDHELVSNIDADCALRISRAEKKGPVRWLLTVGGAGAQAKLFAALCEKLLDYVDKGEAVLCLNVGDHKKILQQLQRSVPRLKNKVVLHENNFEEAASFAAGALEGESSGVHVFVNSDIFAAVYITNLLMRCSDVLITKPSELSFYPIPKLMIHRVGGHEAYGALRAAELGDGTYELEKTEEALAMIDSMQSDRSLITRMCESIRENGRAGIYDGAYEVIKLATGHRTV